MSELHYDRIKELEERGLTREQLHDALVEQLVQLPGFVVNGVDAGPGYDDECWAAFIGEIAEEEELDEEVVAYLMADC
jgi:hypothetical protein